MGVKRGGGLGVKVSKLTTEMRRQLEPVVAAVAGSVQSHAKSSIMNGSQSGKGHVASLPGQPPNNDTQHLHDSIKVEKIDQLTAQVVVHAAYGAALELGSSKMAERPYMRPAVKATDKRGKAAMRAAVERVVKGQKFRSD